MKTLQAFWHWVDNERPEKLEFGCCRHLSLAADHALDAACGIVGRRVGSPYRSVGFLREHWPAIRDLSLAICPALERAYEALPVETPPIHIKATGPSVITGIDLAKDAPEALHVVARRVNEQLMNGDGLKPLRRDPFTERLIERAERAAMTGAGGTNFTTSPERPEPPVGAD
jgi:hypothetical protein